LGFRGLVTENLKAVKALVIQLAKFLELSHIFPPVIVGTRPRTQYIQQVLDQLVKELEGARAKKPYFDNFAEFSKSLRDVILYVCEQDDGYAEWFVRFCHIIKESNPPPNHTLPPLF
jgi:hypothetical protein